LAMIFALEIRCLQIKEGFWIILDREIVFISLLQSWAAISCSKINTYSHILVCRWQFFIALAVRCLRSAAKGVYWWPKSA
jgi:hypothetical protein